MLDLVLALLLAAPPAETIYRTEIETWRTQREASLKKETGWLSVAGLFPLKEGEQTVGTARDSAIVLPAGSAPDRAAVLAFREGRAFVRGVPGVPATANGEPLTVEREMQPDVTGSPTELRVGRLFITVIERGGVSFLRVRDPERKERREFAGLSWYAVDPRWRIVARWVPFDPPRSLPIANVLGQRTPMPAPGEAVFTVGGKEYRLQPVLEEEGGDLFFIFRDATSARETYGAGRFLYAAPPTGPEVVLDFNKAYSPPCAFTPFATCPLPPAQNRLSLRVEAGEKTPQGAAHPALAE